MSLHPGWFGLADTASAVRFSFLTVGLWWGLFTLFTLAWVKEKPSSAPPVKNLLRQSFQDLVNTLRQIRALKPLFLFLLAYWCYMDGVDTIVRMAVDYGISIGFKSTDLITALIITQFVGFPAALAFGKLGQKWRVRNAIFLALLVYTGVTAWSMFMDKKWEFYALAAIVGLVQGGIQALSRSYFARMIPHGQEAKFFGFYNMVGKFAVILGPALVGLTGIAVRGALLPPFPTKEQAETISLLASRLSIGSVMIFFIVGGMLLYFAKQPETPP
jgi:UMF1 family MFS transporter